MTKQSFYREYGYSGICAGIFANSSFPKCPKGDKLCFRLSSNGENIHDVVIMVQTAKVFYATGEACGFFIHPLEITTKDSYVDSVIRDYYRETGILILANSATTLAWDVKNNTTDWNTKNLIKPYQDIHNLFAFK
jgi:hypothetical protein